MACCRPKLFATLATTAALNAGVALALYHYRHQLVPAPDYDDVATATAYEMRDAFERRWLAWSFVCVGFVYAALATAVLAAAVKAKKWMWLIGKTPEGAIPLWSRVAWFPFYAFITVAGRCALRFDRNHRVMHEVAPGFFVSSWHATRPNSGVAVVTAVAATKPAPEVAAAAAYAVTQASRFAGILDLTAELPRVATRHADTHYLCLPTWDGQPPALAAIVRGVDFLIARRAAGPVLVHCAYGRGRSVLLLVAALVKSGAYPTWPEAFAHVKSVRPTAKLNSQMRRALDQWQAFLTEEAAAAAAAADAKSGDKPKAQ